MMSRWLLALRSVLRAPHAIEHDLSRLLIAGQASARRAPIAEAQQTVRLAHRILNRLGRLHMLHEGRWRATCLYRSVAETLILRELGFPARTVIGARLDAATNTIAAHAWVECPGVACASTRGEQRYEILNASHAVSTVL